MEQLRNGNKILQSTEQQHIFQHRQYNHGAVAKDIRPLIALGFHALQGAHGAVVCCLSGPQCLLLIPGGRLWDAVARVVRACLRCLGVRQVECLIPSGVTWEIRFPGVLRPGEKQKKITALRSYGSARRSHGHSPLGTINPSQDRAGFSTV